MKLKIVRLTEYKEATLGMLLIDGWPLLKTLERPWLNNQKQESCIPEGKYRIRNVESPRFGSTYEICDVPNRSHILIHAGNTINDSLGCVIVGSTFGKLAGVPAVLQSRAAFDVLKSTLGDDIESTIEIVRAA